MVVKGYRLINTKFPTIEIFENIASKADYQDLYDIQAMTNPRLRNQRGDINLIHPDHMPEKLTRGFNQALAPFTHINPNGGRFNDGSFGALYMTEQRETALAEVRYHQEQYLKNIDGVKFDRILMRELNITIDPVYIYNVVETEIDILHPTCYQASQALARKLRASNIDCVKYPSVRHNGGTCYALLTPKPIIDVVEGSLVEMMWNGTNLDLPFYKDLI